MEQQPFGRLYFLRRLFHLILRRSRSRQAFISPAWKDRLRTAYASQTDKWLKTLVYPWQNIDTQWATIQKYVLSPKTSPDTR